MFVNWWRHRRWNNIRRPRTLPSLPSFYYNAGVLFDLDRVPVDKRSSFLEQMSYYYRHAKLVYSFVSTLAVRPMFQSRKLFYKKWWTVLLDSVNILCHDICLLTAPFGLLQTSRCGSSERRHRSELEAHRTARPTSGCFWSPLRGRLYSTGLALPWYQRLRRQPAHSPSRLLLHFLLLPFWNFLHFNVYMGPSSFSHFYWSTWSDTPSFIISDSRPHRFHSVKYAHITQWGEFLFLPLGLKNSMCIFNEDEIDWMSTFVSYWDDRPRVTA